jgi:hypothetical protein
MDLGQRHEQRRARMTAVGLALATTAWTANALGAGRTDGCSDPRVEIAPHIASRWLEPISSLCDAFGSMKDVDPAAHLRLVPAGNDLLLEASLGTDRVALRRVRSPEDLLTVVEAVTVVIPQENQGVHAPRATGQATGEDRAGEGRHVFRPLEPALAGPARESVGIELGVGVSARFSRTPAYLSAEAAVYAGLRPGDWFVGVAARWGPSEVPSVSSREGFEMETVGAGFLISRRLVQAPALDLDVGASAMLLVITQSLEERVPDELGSQTDARFGLVTRALFGKSSWRWSPAIDVDVSPARARHALRIDPALPPMPSWSLALTLGATWVDS